jgi:hypothetical protein
MSVSDRYVLVGFPDRPLQGRFTRLDKALSALEIVADPGDPRHAGLRVDADSLCKPMQPVRKAHKSGEPVPVEWTPDQAYQLFLAKYPDGFAGAKFVEDERAWKWEKHLEWQEQFPGTALRDGAASDPVETARRVMRVVQTTVVPLLDPRGEIPIITHALEEPESTRRYLEALADYLDADPPSAGPFERMVEAVTSLPTSRKTGRLASWPILTAVPFLAQPTRHMFLKPVPTRTFAKRIGFDLLYSAPARWDTYDRVLQMSHELAAYLRPYGARDLIDVQSFIWVVTK